MNNDQKLLFLHCIFSLAWADGAFVSAERDYLNAMIEGIGAGADVSAKVQSWLDHAPATPDWDKLGADPELGTMILHKALTLSMLDMSVTIREMSFLQQLAQRLGLDDLTFYKLQQQVEQELMAR